MRWWWGSNSAGAVGSIGVGVCVRCRSRPVVGGMPRSVPEPAPHQALHLTASPGHHRAALSAPTAATVKHSRKKVVRGFLGSITSRKNLKKWRYLSDKKGRLTWRQWVETIDRLATEATGAQRRRLASWSRTPTRATMLGVSRRGP